MPAIKDHSAHSRRGASSTRSPGSHARRDRPRSTGSAGGWRTTALNGPWRQTIDFYALLLLFAACALGGGTAFADVPSLLYVRPIAVICLTLFALTPAAIDWRSIRVPMVLLALFAALMIAQLIPLPPAMWTALPGRALYAQAAVAAGMSQPWRPISLTPDLTFNSLASLVVPAAVVIGMAKLSKEQRRATLFLFIALCFASALLGIAQFAGGKDSPLYLYRRTYPGFPVGFLSNRNHQAALLASLFPALRLWTLMPSANRVWRRNRQWAALALAIFTVPVVLATGSRAGIGLMILGVAAAFLMFAAPGDTGATSGRLRRIMLWLLPLGALAGLIIVTYWFGRAASIERLMSLSAQTDQRVQFAPTVLQITREQFLLGTGFGSFDPVFRQYEPDAILITSVFNHAHNELLELIITAGVPGVALLLAFLTWWAVRIIATARGGRGDPTVQLARFGGLLIAFLLLASLVDYTLRPPLMSAIFALGCCWLSAGRNDGSGSDAARIVTSDDGA